MSLLESALPGLLLLAASGPREAVVLLSADRGGALAPCTGCPEAAALGGAARLGTLVREQRAHRDTLLVDAGNAFFGASDAADEPGAAVRDLYEVLGYDVVNVAYADFRFGVEATLALLAETSFVPVSANLREESGDGAGALLFDPYAVRAVGDERVAVVGLTARPPGLDYLPHLKRQLAGARVTDPLEELESLLPRARSEADRVVVLAYGDRELLAALRDRFGEDVDAIGAGGVRPHELPPARGPGPSRLAASTAGGRHLTRFRLGEPGPIELLEVGPDLPPDDEVDALLEGRLASPYRPPTEDPPTEDPSAVDPSAVDPSAVDPRSVESGPRDSSAVGETVPPREVVVGAPAAPASPPPGAPTWSPVVGPPAAGTLERERVSAASGGLALAVLGGAYVTELGRHRTNDDTLLLALDVELGLAEDAQPLGVRRLEELLFGVVDRKRAVGVRTVLRAGGLRPHFELDPGEAVAGTVGFELPRAGFESFSLELAPPDRAGVHVPVFEAARPWPAPLATRENRVFEVDLLGFETAGELDGRRAPNGATFLAVDLRARHHLAGDGPVAGRLAWHRMTDRVQLVVDGLFAFEPIGTAPSELSDDLSLFTTERLGGRLVFDPPSELITGATSVELVCGFEPVELPGGGFARPASLSFAIVGTPREVALPEGGARVEDLDCTTVVSGLRVDAAERGGARVTADVWISAPEGRGVVVDPRQRLALIDAVGEVHAPGPESWSATSPSKKGRPFWIPPRGVRRLTVVFPGIDPGGAVLLLRGLLRIEALAVDGGARALDPLRSARGELVVDETLEPAGLAGAGLAGAGLAGAGLAGAGLAPEDVERAIDRGRDFLWDSLRPQLERRPLGRIEKDFPAVLALLHCDGHERYPELADAVGAWLEAVRVHDLRMYQLALLVLVLDALDDPAHGALLERALTYLVESQGPGGTWDYDTVLAPRLIGADDAGRARIDRTQSWFSNGDGDNSTSQFAVLALAAAERHGIVVDDETWRRVLECMTFRQRVSSGGDAYGGWGYLASTPYGSMTCAGICMTAIALRRLEPAADPLRDLRVRDGLGWLARHWSVEENPAYHEWSYYHLYGVERVGQVLGIEHVGAHEWYPEGAAYLTRVQNGDGSWTGAGREADPHLATAFALLFLRRATRSLDPEVLAVGPGTLETHQAPAAERGSVYVILDASGSMLAEVGGRRKFDHARDAVRELAERLPPETPFALRVYGHTLRAIEDGAEEDTALVIPFGALDPSALSATLDGLRPRGKTPLTLSLERARADLAQARSGGDVLVLLLTDGGEDTRRDPIAAAREWRALGGVELVIVGFDIDRPRWSQQLRAMADAAGGRYLPVAAAADLAGQVVGATDSAAAEFVVEDATGETVARGRCGDALTLDAGTYTVVFEAGGRTVRRSVNVRAGRTVRVRLDESDRPGGG